MSDSLAATNMRHDLFGSLDAAHPTSLIALPPTGIIFGVQINNPAPVAVAMDERPVGPNPRAALQLGQVPRHKVCCEFMSVAPTPQVCSSHVFQFFETIG
jgi:hypothetical protein